MVMLFMTLGARSGGSKINMWSGWRWLHNCELLAGPVIFQISPDSTTTQGMLLWSGGMM